MKNLYLASALVSILATAGTVRADHLTLTDVAGLTYHVNDAITFATSSSASGAASEAEFSAPISASTAMGGTSMAALNDMFDGYGTIAVASDPAQQVHVTTGNAGQEIYNRTGGAYTLSCGDREMIFPTVASTLIPGLSISRRVFVPTDDTFLRWTEVLTNTGTTDLTVYVGTGNNLGSDSNTQIIGSSSGDLIGDTTDTWVATMQGFGSGTTSSDPRSGHVLRGTGSSATVMTTISFTDGDDNPFWWYQVAIPAGATRLLMHFVTGAGTQALARSQAQAIANLTTAATIACFTATERREIVNFNAVCTSALEAAACDDGDLCTTGDVCTAGVCVGTALDCRGGLGNCVGTCDPTTGTCNATAALVDGTACDDGSVCTNGDACVAGVCGAGAAIDCADTNACTTDACDVASGCTHTMISMCQPCTTTSDCDDGNACNGAEVCTAGMCAAGTALDCADGDACTTDACAGAGCTHTPITTGVCAPDTGGPDAATIADAGGHDAGAHDAGTTGDASAARDGGAPAPATSSCGCSAAGTGPTRGGAILLVGLAIALASRRRRG